MRQQPGAGKTKLAPHSTPGWRSQFEPEWNVGPHTGASCCPSGPKAENGGWELVIPNTVLICSPTSPSETALSRLANVAPFGGDGHAQSWSRPIAGPTPPGVPPDR